MGQSDRAETVGDMGIESVSHNGESLRTVVIVVGSLGELVKKLIETEMRIREAPKDRDILLEVASLHRLLEQWPVVDSEKADNIQMGMRLSIAKLKATELELSELLPKVDNSQHLSENSFWLKQLASDMLKYMNEVRKQIVELNKLSGGVGKASALSPDAKLIIAQEG